MHFDINSVISGATEALSDDMKKEGEAVLSELHGALSERQDILTELTQALEAGDISQAEFEEEVAREQKVIEAELLTQEIHARATIQQAVNAVFSTLTSSILRGA